MAWYLKWPADSGSLPANNRLVQVSGIATTGAFNVAITYAENFPAQARGHYLYDGRRSLDSNTDDGTNSYIFNGGQVNTSNWRVNGVTTGSSGSLINTSRVAGDVISFDATAQPNGVIAIGARFNATESFSNVAISRIVITDSAGTHTIDMSDSNGTATQFTSTDGVLTLKLFNFNPATCWIFSGSADVSSSVAATWPMFSVSATQSQSVSGVTSNIAATWPMLAVSANQSQSIPGASSSVAVSWPMFSVSANQSQATGFVSSVSVTWPMFSVSAVQSQSVPPVSMSVSATWPLFVVSAAQSEPGFIPPANSGAYVIQAYVGGQQTISAKIGGRQTINAMVAI